MFMIKKKLKGVLSFAVCFSMLSSHLAISAQAEEVAKEPDWQTGVIDHWNFDTFKSDMGHMTEGEPNQVEIVQTDDPIFGNVLRFGDGPDRYMRLNDYINTGSGATTFSLWYRYDTKITGENEGNPAVILQHEDPGRSLLTLQNDGTYNTFINQKNISSKNAAKKGEWQHITVVFDQEQHQVTYYLNGVPDSTQDMGTQAVSQAMSLRLGGHKAKGNMNPHPMRGDVDEFYVYQRALSASEAKALYEDKAKLLYDRDLQDLIQKAETLYNEGLLSQDSSEAQELLEALKRARSANTFDGIKTAMDSLRHAMQAYQEQMPIKLEIDLNKVSHQIDPDSIFGINHRYAFNGYGTFDSEQMKMHDEFKEIYQDIGFGSIRYPGGTISNLFNWKTAIGPKAQRKKQIHGFYNNPKQGGIAPNFGISEVADFASEVGSEIVYVYSLGRGNAADAADLVEYLNAEVGTNPNGGIDWAAVRAKNGHEAPYNVRHFEIGNEMQQAWAGDGTVSQGYWTLYVKEGHVKAYTQGGLAQFDKIYTVDEENWNKEASVSDGSKNLVRYMRYANENPCIMKGDEIIPDPSFQAVNEGVEVFVGTDKKNERWEVVDDLSQSAADAKHCEVDYSTGAIRFGDGTHGMIPPAGQNIYASYSVQRDGFIAVSNAIKETTRKINETEGKTHEAKVYTSHESKAFIDLMDSLNKNDLYDGMTIHPYSDPVPGGNDTKTFYDNAMKQAESSGIGKVKKYVDMMPSDKVPVISEYGIYKNLEPQVRSQTHAIYIAKVLMEYVRMKSPYIQKHCLADWYIEKGDSLGPTQQAVIQVVPLEDANTQTGEGRFGYFATPSAYVFKMLNSGFGENIVRTTLDRTPQMSNGAQTLSALASTDREGNIYVAMVNSDREKDQTVALDIKDYDLSGRTIEIQRLESEDIADENTLDDPNHVSIHYEDATADTHPSMRLKKHSFAVIKILNQDSSNPNPAPTPPTPSNPSSSSKPSKPNPKPSTPTEPQTPDPTPQADPVPHFTDVTETSWYADAVAFVVKRSLFNGISETSFAPNTAMTRGMLIAVLHRLAGEPQAEGDGYFVDISNQYYTDAVKWAVSNGIVNGISKDHFSPDLNITREQLAAILYRYAALNHYDTSESQVLTGFADGTQVSSFAADAMQWANAAGLVNGTLENKLNPKGNATRAEVAVILQRFCSKYSA